MKHHIRLIAAGGIAVSAAMLLGGTSRAATQGPAHWRAERGTGAVFAQTDSAGGNAIVVYDRAADGTLTQAGVYATGGAGGILSGSVVDHLASQDSLVYDRARGLLYAVNAGSNTVTVFSVDGPRLIRRQVTGSGGTFPVSVAVHGDLVYVLNARDGGSVQGFVLAGGRLVRIPAWHRTLGLNPAQTPEFLSTPGDIAFTPDGSELLVTTKTNQSVIDVYRIGPLGAPSAEPAVNADPGNAPFGISFDAGGHAVIAEAGPNALAAFTPHRDGTLALLGRLDTGQQATCWVIRDGSTFFVSNAGSADVSRVSDDGSGTLLPLGTTPTDKGTVDAATSPDGQYLYVQTGAAGIVDEYRVGPGGLLNRIGSVTVPDAVGGEGIAAS
jgi:DNA-binding beta-propeller fold protein YncE